MTGGECLHACPCEISNLVGGWALPLWKMIEFVSWDDEIPNLWKIKFMFQTTNQQYTYWQPQIPKIWKHEKSSKPPTNQLMLGIYKQTFEIWSWVAFEICLAKKGEIITASIGLFNWKNTKNLTLCKLDPPLHFFCWSATLITKKTFFVWNLASNITWYWPLLTATHYLGIHQWKAQLVYPGNSMIVKRWISNVWWSIPIQLTCAKCY
jgi:hypothetical protein